jgi:hypothetical protein
MDEHEAMQPCTVSVWLSGSSVCKTRPCALSLDIFPIYQVLYIMHAKKNSHPAGVVRPPYLEIGKDGENWRLVAAASVLRGDGNRRKVGAGIVVHVKAIWATTKLGAISRADHRAITRGCRSAVIGDGGTAVFRKHLKRL